MGEVINVTEKKTFIKWFLEHHVLQNREAEWLLQYLASNDAVLEHVHFIDNFRNLPKTILMSTKCVQMTPFKFYKNKRVTSDVEKAFLDIHNNVQEDVYIGLFFKDRNTSPEYASVLEQNPTDDPREITDVLVSLEAEMMLDFAIRDYHKARVLREIDQALDAKNKNKFFDLTKELRLIEELG